MNQVRGYHFLLSVFRNQQKDPYCSVCSAFANTLRAARDNFATFESVHNEALKALTPEFGGMLALTRAGLSTLQGPADPSGQKKAGNCKLPQGMCFIKASFALVQQI
ncbi:MAG: hypothetical protein HGA43_14120 [Nitrospirae bacterium]|nr:hypothetical protein [Nitrospirota bacterium]